jgi:hypothetical protein
MNIDRVQLEKMIDANQAENFTEDIRAKKHSKLIRDDVARLVGLKKKYARLAQTNIEQFDRMCTSQCSFIFTNYTDIYNRVKKDELNLEILSKLLDVLKKIEDGKLDQHEGSVVVGTVLKELYVDSALQKANKLEEKYEKHKKTESRPKQKNISWEAYKAKFLEKE